MSVALGTSWSSSVPKLTPTEVALTSMRGEPPVTVMASATPAIGSVASMVNVLPVVTSTPSRWKSWNPGSSNRRL
jgi:hypothetical protein